MSETLGTTSDLQLVIPSDGDTDWATSIRTLCFQKIVDHTHAGSGGAGVQLTGTTAIVADTIDDTLLKLNNNAFIKSVNAASSGNINMIKINASDLVEFGVTLSSPVMKTPQIQDTSSNHQYVFAVSELVADRTVTLPLLTGNDTFTFNAFAATLTNKTIDSDNNTITNIVNADIKSTAAIAYSKLAALTDGNILVGNGSNVAVSVNPSGDVDISNAGVFSIASDVIINADIKTDAAIAATKIADGSVTSTEFQYINTLSSNAQTQINAKEGTLTNSAGLASALSDETGTGVVVFGTTPTIATPVITSANLDQGTASNSSRIVLPKDTTSNLDGLTDTAALIAYDTTLNKPVFNNGTVWAELGGGAGGINHIDNTNAEAGVTGYAAYADSAGVAPVNGVDGSPTTTFTQNTSSPLRGNADFKITKDAANRQGEGASNDFSIDASDNASVMRVTFDYITSSAYADGDYRVYIYDVTNSNVIELSTRDLAGITTGGQYVGEFQAHSSSTSYRLIWHCASTNASAYTINFDNVSVGPRSVHSASVITDWTTFDMVINGVTADPTKSSTTDQDYSAWRRVGDTMELFWSYREFSATGAATGTGNYLFKLPEGYSIDMDHFTNVAATIQNAVGSASGSDGSNQTSGTMNVADSTHLFMNLGSAAVNPTAVSSTYFDFTTSILLMSFKAVVPIAGWSSNMTISEDLGNQDVVVNAHSNGGEVLTADTTNITWNTERTDTTGSWSGTVFTAPSTGTYNFKGSVYFTSGVSAQIDLYVNTVQTTRLSPNSGSQTQHHFSGSHPLNKGDTISFRSIQGGTLSTSADDILHWLSISKLQSPQTLLGGEEVFASGAGNGGTSITADVTNIDFTETSDSHGAFNGTQFTAPTTGRYLVTGQVIATAAFTGGVRSYIDAVLDRNIVTGGGQNDQLKLISGIVPLDKGQILSIRTTSSITLSNDVVNHHISIEKL